MEKDNRRIKPVIAEMTDWLKKQGVWTDHTMWDVKTSHKDSLLDCNEGRLHSTTEPVDFKSTPLKSWKEFRENLAGLYNQYKLTSSKLPGATLWAVKFYYQSTYSVDFEISSTKRALEGWIDQLRKLFLDGAMLSVIVTEAWNRKPKPSKSVKARKTSKPRTVKLNNLSTADIEAELARRASL